MSKTEKTPRRHPPQADDSITAGSPTEQLTDALRRAVDTKVGPGATFAEREAAYIEAIEEAVRAATARSGR